MLDAWYSSFILKWNVSSNKNDNKGSIEYKGSIERRELNKHKGTTDEKRGHRWTTGEYR